MGRIHRKIEALERATSIRRKACQKMACQALSSLSDSETELLISAFGAERAGRELIEREEAARKVYTQALRQECQQARRHSPLRLEHRDYIQDAILRALGNRVTLERLELIRDAMNRGGELSAAEAEAVEVYVWEMDRLQHLAGLETTAEYEAFRRRAAGGEL